MSSCNDRPMSQVPLNVTLISRLRMGFRTNIVSVAVHPAVRFKAVDVEDHYCFVQAHRLQLKPPGKPKDSPLMPSDLAVELA